MQLKTLLLTPLLAAGLTNALPQRRDEDAGCPAPPPPSDVQAFGLLALRSASDIHYARVSAKVNSIFLRLDDQGATCEKESDNTATFYLKDGQLFLYTGDGPKQQIFADRSGMGTWPLQRNISANGEKKANKLPGQGKMGYITGEDAGKPRNAELDGWALDETGNLNLRGSEFLACPGSIEGAWSVWVEAGTSTPGYNEGCIGFSARAVPIDDPNSCTYTDYEG